MRIGPALSLALLFFSPSFALAQQTVGLTQIRSQAPTLTARKKVRVIAIVPNMSTGSIPSVPIPEADLLLSKFLKHYGCKAPIAVINHSVLEGGPMDTPGELYSASFSTYCERTPSIDGIADQGTEAFLAYSAIASDWCEQSNCNLIYFTEDRSSFYMGRVEFPSTPQEPHKYEAGDPQE